MTPIERGYDAALHLLDRQIVDASGRLLGKVDDIELTVAADGETVELVPTGLMVGPAAWLPRLGPQLGARLEDVYERLRVAHVWPGSPAVIDFDLVAGVSSAVHLTHDCRHLLLPRVEPRIGPRRHRLGELMGMRVAGLPRAGPTRRVRVLDVRIANEPAEAGAFGQQRVTALVVGAGRPGALLGYDRRDSGGPWPVAALVRRLHRHSVLLEWGQGVEVDWGRRRVVVSPPARTGPLC